MKMTALLSSFELRVIGLALRGGEGWLAEMRNQVAHLAVIERRAIGGGFKVIFECSNAATPVHIPKNSDGLPVKGYPPAINARRGQPVEGLVSFIVWLGRDGKISELEGCSLTDDQWPDDLFSSFYDFQDDSGHVIEK
jgi:hypothetical protein